MKEYSEYIKSKKEAQKKKLISVLENLRKTQELTYSAICAKMGLTRVRIKQLIKEYNLKGYVVNKKKPKTNSISKHKKSQKKQLVEIIERLKETGSFSYVQVGKIMGISGERVRQLAHDFDMKDYRQVVVKDPNLSIKSEVKRLIFRFQKEAKVRIVIENYNSSTDSTSITIIYNGIEKKTAVDGLKEGALPFITELRKTVDLFKPELIKAFENKSFDEKLKYIKAANPDLYQKLVISGDKNEIESTYKDITTK